MYKKIFIAIDNSLHSNYCIDLGIAVSKKFDSRLVGCHVYDASLHQRRFRDMEKGLPPQYQDETALQRQRNLHSSLINLGLKLISESYLDVFKNKCREAAVPHESLLLEGKNYYEIIKELASALILLDGFKAIGENAHKDLIDYLIKYKEFSEADIVFINDLRIKRNNSFYEGKRIEPIYLKNNKERILGIIERLKKMIKF